MRRLALTGILAALVLPATASGAVTIGLNPLPDPNASADACLLLTPCTVANTALPGAQVASPLDGVVVRWRVRSDNNGTTTVAALRVIRPAGAAFTGVSTSGPVNLSSLNPETVESATQQPIRTGDQIALDLGEPHNNLSLHTPLLPGSGFVRWQPLLAAGETRAPTSPYPGETAILLNADIEPDSDCDGRGDETQDTAVGARCEATISKGPKRKIKTRKKKVRVTFEFQAGLPGLSFQCKLDQGAFAPCTSPTSYKVRRGRHTFVVHALDFRGAPGADSSFTFQVRKKRKR